MDRSFTRRIGVGLLVCAAATLPHANAQDEASKDGRTLSVEPTSLALEVGETAKLTAKVVDDATGEVVEEPVFFFSRARRSVTVTPDGDITAVKPGEFTIIARTARKREDRISFTIPVSIAPPPVARIEFVDVPSLHVEQMTLAYSLQITDELGGTRENATIAWTTSDDGVASVDDYGHVTGVAAGSCTLTATCEEQSAFIELRIAENPASRLELSVDHEKARTGDVLHFTCAALDASGAAVQDLPVHYSFRCKLDDQLGPSATGQILPDGRFVAEQSGLYTIVATCGERSAQKTVRIDDRGVTGKFEFVGHGPVFECHTSDLWVWEGVDGRDYAVTGTWGADGHALFWDVTDPANIQRIASVQVDARTVNDVKVTEDGTLCVISREGASNRKNGVVLIDVTNPAQPEVLSSYVDELTGGVHNVFLHDDHVYALSAGRRYDTIDITNPRQPKKVGQYELESASHSIHDVWVVDGIAYSSNWSDGVHIVDVGNGVAGGTEANPVFMSSYAYPSGWNHAAFPYWEKQSGKFYVIAGDEAFPYGLHVTDKPTYPRGWLHFIDFTDLEEPVEIARYQVPEAGSHNYWVEDDVLYAAFYNGGVRAVDISGELVGDLYHQGREIAWYIPTHPEGKIPNAAMVWGPQPYKGHVFFSDWNSGLWAAKLVWPGNANSSSTSQESPR